MDFMGTGLPGCLLIYPIAITLMWNSWGISCFQQYSVISITTGRKLLVHYPPTLMLTYLFMVEAYSAEFKLIVEPMGQKDISLLPKRKTYQVKKVHILHNLLFPYSLLPCEIKIKNKIN